MLSVPIELYRPIVEFLEDRWDLFTLCFVCHAMRDEAERVIYSVVKLTTTTISLAIQLASNQRQRRHIQHLGIAEVSHRYRPNILPPLIDSLPASLVTLSLFDAHLGPEFYIALSRCYFPRLKEFTCTSFDHYWIPEDNSIRSTIPPSNLCFITFLMKHSTIEKLFWKGENQEIPDHNRTFVPETLPRLRFLDASAVLAVPLLASRPITHISVKESQRLPAPRSLALMTRLVAFECHETSSNGPLIEILELAPQLKFFGTIYIGSIVNTVSANH